MADALRITKEIDYPFRFDPNGGGVAFTTDPVRMVANHIKSIVLTDFNERAMRPDYGSPTRQYLFGNTDSTTMQELQTRLATAIAQWEPNVTIQHVRPIPHPLAEAILEIEVSFSVPPNTEVYRTFASAGKVVQ